MDPSSWLLVLLYLGFLAVGSYFAACEMAYSSVSKIRLLSRKEEGDKAAARALAIGDKYDYYLITLLVGTNICNVCSAAVSTIYAARLYTYMRSAGISVTESTVTAVTTVVTTILIFLFVENIPKTYAKDNAERVAVKAAPSLRAFGVLLYPIAILFMGLSKLTDKIIGKKEEPTVTEEELSDIIETSEEQGVLDEDESDLLQSALEFSTTTVADVVTLRDDVEWLDVRASKAEILRAVKKTRFSRLPVCRGDFDHPVGILIVNDFLKTVIRGEYTKLYPLLRKPYFTNLDASIDDLKDEMSGKRQHLALVRARDGVGIVGIVTIEDFVEELVGEIFDEQDVVDDNFMKLGGNYFEVSGKLTLGEALRRIGYLPKTPVPRGKSVATWILGKLGRIPEEEDEFVFEDLTVTVDEVEGGRVSRATFKLADPEIDAPLPETEGEADAQEEDEK